jgi:hypothetical protein
MRRYNGEDGSQVDDLEEANKREDMALKNPNAKEYGESGTSYTTKASPKATAKSKKPEQKAERRGLDGPSKYGMLEEDYSKPVTDKTKMSVSERAKANRESARSGSSTTDRRSVNERIRSAVGMKNGGSASSRADGIATKGKTRGKMC